MSLRLKVKDATPTTTISSNGSEKANQTLTLTLSNIFTIAKKSFLSKRVLASMVVVLGLYTIFDVLYDRHISHAIFYHKKVTEFSSNNNSDSISNIASKMEYLQDQEYYHQKPVKVYLYDLPHRFTYGIIEYHRMSHTNRPMETDATKLNYPAHQHMAEWFIFKDLLLPNSERTNSPVVRVDDPDEAELFYVPFFSSLSMIVTRLPWPDKLSGYNDEATQKALIEWLEGQEYWKRNNGRDHVIVASDPNAYHAVIDKVKNCVMLVAGFGRLRADQGSLVKDVVAPYMHRVSSYIGEVGVETRNDLLFFMGARYRKEGGKIRDMLFDILEKEEGVVMKQGTQSKEDRRAASTGMHTSKFCLNPAGDTSTSCRLFDSIVSLCVPVIVSDEIELPFEDVIDYTKIAIFVATDEALKPGVLASMLRTIPDEKIIQYQLELKEVKPYFDFRSETLNQIWREVTNKLPFIKMMINREKRLSMISSDNLAKPTTDCSCLCSNETNI